MSCSCGPLLSLTFSQCLLWLSSIHLLSFALLSSLPLTMPPQAADPQPCSRLPASGKVGAQGRRLGVSWGRIFWASPPPSLHKCLRPQPSPQGPHLARVLSFPGCKLPPATPWHLLRFRLHERLFLLGDSERDGGPVLP